MTPEYPPIPVERSSTVESEQLSEVEWYIYEDLNYFFTIIIE
jgi:hypothetical protein